MSQRIIPTPEEFRVFCEFGFSQSDHNVKIFYSCCVQCGLESIRDEMDGEACFMFATVEDLEHAGEEGKLLFHHGFRTETSEITSDEDLATEMVQVLRDQGMLVEWDGDPAQRFKVSVDRYGYQILAKHLAEKLEDADPLPTTAILIDSEYPDYKIHVWLDPHGIWWYDVSTVDGTYQFLREKAKSRDDAVQEALTAVEELHLDMN